MEVAGRPDQLDTGGLKLGKIGDAGKVAPLILVGTQEHLGVDASASLELQHQSHQITDRLVDNAPSA
ncbi:MAG: hypothetical protein ERJ69_07190 [Aphanocapsa feldmannii 288cV]|nr:MAG: hypothetical protein ERJ69_07190 [Aphanocapsa feldmannii 288cV]